MFSLIKARINQGSQYIKDIGGAEVKKPFRGFPGISSTPCRAGCESCRELCPTRAISLDPVQIDLGKCIFCGDCESGCPGNIITFSSFHKIAASSLGNLVIDKNTTVESYSQRAITSRAEIKKVFGRSLKLRQISAGGCNGCEMELNACSNVNFDMQRFGIEFVASPRHADGVVITGPISENMAFAVEDTYKAVPGPKIIILVGACAISGGLFASSPALNREFLREHPIDLYVPGCPPHPLTFINGVLSIIK